MWHPPNATHTSFPVPRPGLLLIQCDTCSASLSLVFLRRNRWRGWIENAKGGAADHMDMWKPEGVFEGSIFHFLSTLDDKIERNSHNFPSTWLHLTPPNDVWIRMMAEVVMEIKYSTENTSFSSCTKWMEMKGKERKNILFDDGKILKIFPLIFPLILFLWFHRMNISARE